jgi:hypothetical protein
VLRPAISKAIASQQNKIIKIQHTGGAAAKLIEARALLNLQERQFNESIVTWKAMARKQINQEQFDDYIRDVFQLQDTQDLGRLKAYEPLLENFERGLGSDIQGVRGTVWGAYQSITQYATHQVSARGEDSYTQMKSRLNSLIVGNGSLLLKRAQEIAVKVAVF